MAYIPKQIPEDEQNQFGRTEDTTPNPIPPQGGGSSGTGIQGQGQGGVAPGQASSTQFGSNAAKLSDYLKANEPQVAEFGNQVAGKLNEGYNTAKGAIDQGYAGFNQQVNQGWNQPDQDKINQAISNPTEFAKDPNNVSSFQGWYNNEYKGPQNFEGSDTYSGINNKVSQAVQNAGMVNNQQGLTSYLNNFMGTGNNTPGMQTLDTALLQRSPDARSTIQNAAKPYEGLNNYLGAKTSEANQGVQSAQQQANQTRQSLQNQFTGEGGIIPTFQKGLTDRQQDMEGQRQRFNSAYDKFGNPSKDLSASIAEYNKVVADNPMNTFAYMRQNGAPDVFNLAMPDRFADWAKLNPIQGIGMENVASQEDLDTQSALNRLTGSNVSMVPSQLNPVSVPQQYPQNFNKELFDYSQYLNDLYSHMPDAMDSSRTGQGASRDKIMQAYNKMNLARSGYADQTNEFGKTLYSGKGDTIDKYNQYVDELRKGEPWAY